MPYNISLPERGAQWIHLFVAKAKRYEGDSIVKNGGICDWQLNIFRSLFESRWSNLSKMLTQKEREEKIKEANYNLFNLAGKMSILIF